MFCVRNFDTQTLAQNYDSLTSFWRICRRLVYFVSHQCGLGPKQRTHWTGVVVWLLVLRPDLHAVNRRFGASRAQIAKLIGLTVRIWYADAPMASALCELEHRSR